MVAATVLAAWPGSRAIFRGDLAAELPLSPREQAVDQPHRDGYLHALPLITTEAALRPMEALAASLAPDKPKPTAEVTLPAATTAELQSDESPSSQPPPKPQPTPEPISTTYTVQTGDTVAAIAARHGIQTETLLWNNPDLNADPDTIFIGQQLLVPSRDGILYKVKLGDTLTDIADLYKVKVENVAGFVSNEIGNADSVSEGALLLLPGAVPPPPPPPAATPAPVFAAAAPAPTASDSSGAAATAPTTAGFIWPVYGPISEYYGAPRGAGTYHAGLDIDQTYNYGGPVAAAAPGQVVLATSDGYGYGSYVVIRHDNGYETLYAHLSAINVSQGQYVSQGEVIGAIGTTGYSTGPHLHFEVRVGGATVDPLNYLP
jgi:murein DD-endopeptidase MepM/ murein hydrolase activator NlpD